MLRFATACSFGGLPISINSRIAVYVVGLFGISIYALLFFLGHKIYLIGSDTFYYMSIADGIRQTGSVAALSSDPALPLKTPQNGIVMFHLWLSQLGFGAENRLVTIVLINYALHLSAVYPLYKIARRVGLEGTLPIAALLAVYLGAFHVYRLQLIPNNDGVFNALSIWLTYLIIIVLDDHPGPSETGHILRRPSWSVKLALLIVLSAILVHFRLNALLILGAGLVAAVAVRHLKGVLWTAGSLAVAVASLALVYAFIDTSRMASQGEGILDGILGRLPSSVPTVLSETIPNLLFGPWGLWGRLISVPFALALALAVVMALVSGLHRREAAVLFMALSCAAALVFVTLLDFQSHRLLIYVFPILFILIILRVFTRPFGYIFVALVLASSLLTFYRGFDREPASEFWLYVHENKVSLPDSEPLLISEHSRHPYFFLSARTYRGELTLELISSRESLFLIGDRSFVDARLSEIGAMSAESGYSFKLRSLTPGYQDEEGHALLELYDFSLAG